jgi:Circadian oscillating protein COP23
MMKLKSAINLYLAVLSLSSFCFLSAAHAQPMLPEIDPPPVANPPTQQPPVDPPMAAPVQTNTPQVAPPTAPPVQSSSPQVPEQPISTSIRCVNSGGAFTTVAEQGENRAVMFTWRTTEFGPEFTPEKRCQAVSQRFNSFVQANGGTFNNLSLTTDMVNKYPVICMNKTGNAACNILFTLKKENRNQAQKIILSLQNPNELGSDGINEARTPVLNLSEWSKRKLSARKGIAPVPIKKPAARKGGFR